MQIEKLHQLFRESTGISIDSRTLKPGNIFFGLRGSNFNGNLFAEKALASGASLVVVDEKHFPDSEKIVFVNDALKTLQQLANFHRRTLKAKVIAVCGSNGKTTT